MKSRIIVHKEDGSEKYSLVRAATETVAEIDRVIAARDRAMPRRPKTPAVSS